ncbi:unnamed protein product [Prunus armeniaca]
MQDNIAVGIGGSFLGPLQTDPEAIETARGRQLHFLANVDPIDVARNITGLNPETTLEMAPFSSPPRLPRGLKWRLSLVDRNKTPSTAKQIETKLQFADLRRQGPPPTPSPAPSPEPTISPYPASPVHSPAPSPDSNHLPPAPSKVPPHPRPCPYRGSGIPPSSSPTSHPNPTVPPSYAPNGSPYSPSASPYTSPSSQFLQLSVRKVERCVCLYI